MLERPCGGTEELESSRTRLPLSLKVGCSGAGPHLLLPSPISAPQAPSCSASPSLSSAKLPRALRSKRRAAGSKSRAALLIQLQVTVRSGDWHILRRLLGWFPVESDDFGSTEAFGRLWRLGSDCPAPFLGCPNRAFSRVLRWAS